MGWTLKTFYQTWAAPRVFARWAREYEADVIQNRYSAASAVAAAILPYMREDMAITDLGIGTGLIWEGMDIPENVDITGLDLAPAMLAQASVRPEIGALYQCNVGTQVWPIADASQDMVAAAGLFEYLTEPMARHVFAQTLRVLKPGGRAFFTYIPDEKNIAPFWHGRSGAILSCRFDPHWMETHEGLSPERHAPAFTGSVFESGAHYDYRLVVLTKNA